MALLSHGDLATLCSRAYLELTGTAQELEYFIRSAGDLTIIAIRGTETGLITELGILDMIRNVRVLPWYSTATGWAHGGFLSGALAVSAHLNLLIPQGNHIVLTGHSLGAATAILCAQILHGRGRLIDEVVLFGCPRIYPFGRPALHFPVTNYRLGADLVCLMPRLYWHAVPLTRLEPSYRIPNLTDHSIDRYAATLRRQEGEF